MRPEFDYTEYMTSYRLRRLIGFIIVLLLMAIPLSATKVDLHNPHSSAQSKKAEQTVKDLDTIAVKGRAPKTGYSREQFGDGWQDVFGCDTRNIILHRDLEKDVVNSDCKVLSGTLQDPYTGKIIYFARGADTSDDVQIDHVVALSDAWQKGAQTLSFERRVALANDPLELLAVDGPANQEKSDGDAATWLPPNKPFRCQYVTRQIAVKKKYGLWVTQAEKDAMKNVLASC